MRCRRHPRLVALQSPSLGSEALLARGGNTRAVCRAELPASLKRFNVWPDTWPAPQRSPVVTAVRGALRQRYPQLKVTRAMIAEF